MLYLLKAVCLVSSCGDTTCVVDDQTVWKSHLLSHRDASGEDACWWCHDCAVQLMLRRWMNLLQVNQNYSICYMLAPMTIGIVFPKNTLDSLKPVDDCLGPASFRVTSAGTGSLSKGIEHYALVCECTPPPPPAHTPLIGVIFFPPSGVKSRLVHTWGNNGRCNKSGPIIVCVCV